jgi:RNA polymerase sigma factor (sigma-70 family)
MSVEVGGGPARDSSPAAPGDEGQPSSTSPPAGAPDDRHEDQPVIAHSAEDRQAIADLYASYIGCLFDYCQGLLQDPGLAADVAADTLVAARENIAEPRGQEWLRTWLYAVARRLCQRELPPDSERATPDGYLPGPAEAGDPDTTDFELADLEAFTRRRDAQVMIEAAVEGLSPADREVLSLNYRHEITGPDLASVLDVPPDQVKDLVTSAGKRFAAAAATVIVRNARRGWVACPGLVAMAQAEDPPPPPLAPQFRRQLARHLNSCPDCAGFRGERGFGPGLVSAIAPELPTPVLWDRIVASVFDASAGPEPESGEPAWPQWLTPAPAKAAAARSRGRAIWPLAAAAILVVVLAGGGVTYELASGTPGHPQQAKVAAADQAAGNQQPAPAVGSAGPIPAGSRKAPQVTPSLFPAPIGVLPTPPPYMPTPTPTGGRKPPGQAPPHPRPTQKKPSHHPKSPSGSPTPTPTGSGSPSPTPDPTPSSGNSPTPDPPPTSPPDTGTTPGD